MMYSAAVPGTHVSEVCLAAEHALTAKKKSRYRFQTGPHHRNVTYLGERKDFLAWNV